MLWNTFVVVVTVALMEVYSIVVHKYVMHGFGWGWHRSHHEERHGWFEKNDLYAVVSVALSVALIYYGLRGAHPLEWIGIGMAVYGMLYFVAHDGLVHRRWPFKYVPKSGYLKRLYQAHRMHHAVAGREGAVSFGFLYAPPVETLKQQLHVLHGGPLRQRGRAAARGLPDEA
jgi:beta-carotene 3-hydroxylase